MTLSIMLFPLTCSNRRYNSVSSRRLRNSRGTSNTDTDFPVSNLATSCFAKVGIEEAHGATDLRWRDRKKRKKQRKGKERKSANNEKDRAQERREKEVRGKKKRKRQREDSEGGKEC